MSLEEAAKELEKLELRMHQRAVGNVSRKCDITLVSSFDAGTGVGSRSSGSLSGTRDSRRGGYFAKPHILASEA